MGVFAGRKHHKPRQGSVAITLNLHRGGAVGFIDWLGRLKSLAHYVTGPFVPNARSKECPSQA
jgi:hypothetical protein